MPSNQLHKFKVFIWSQICCELHLHCLTHWWPWIWPTIDWKLCLRLLQIWKNWVSIFNVFCFWLILNNNLSLCFCIIYNYIFIRDNLIFCLLDISHSIKKLNTQQIYTIFRLSKFVSQRNQLTDTIFSVYYSFGFIGFESQSLRLYSSAFVCQIGGCSQAFVDEW